MESAACSFDTSGCWFGWTVDSSFLKTCPQAQALSLYPRPVAPQEGQVFPLNGFLVGSTGCLLCLSAGRSRAISRALTFAHSWMAFTRMGFHSSTTLGCKARV